MGKFEMLLDRATNSNNLDPELAAIMEMCDTIRQGDTTPKKAVISVKKKLMDKHSLVSYYTLFVLEALMKNCGPDMHKEILVKEVLGRMQDMVKNPSDFSEKSKEKSLELIQTWNVAFRNDSSYLILTSVYNQLAMAGVRFPEVSTSDAVFITERPPEWKPDKESKECTLCRAEFSLMNRRHHCRNCGECFCSRCCSNSTTLPKFGIEREVRVCESCYIKVSDQAGTGAETGGNETETNSGLPDEYLKSSLFKESQGPPTMDPTREAELKEQEDLDLVIAMSLNEQENKESRKKTVTFAPTVSMAPEPVQESGVGPYAQLMSNRSLPTPPPEVPSYLGPAPESAESELAKYYDREYWEGRREQQGLTASPLPARRQASPVYAQIQLSTPKQQQVQAQAQVQVQGEEEEGEGDRVLAESLKKNLQLFSSLLSEAQKQGRSPATDSSVQSLYGTLNAMHPELLRVMEELEQRRERFEALDRKAAMVREARAALNKSRREYLETVRQQEEQQRLLATMLLEQNIALIRKHQSEQADMGVRLAKERERELREEEERKEEEQRRRRHLVNEHQRMQEQQVVAQHLAQVIPGKFEGNLGHTSPYTSLPPSLIPHGIAPHPMYSPPVNLLSGPSSLPMSLNAPPPLPPSSLTQLSLADPGKPADPFSPLNSSQALQESGLNFSSIPQQVPILPQLQPGSLAPLTALQQPSSLPPLGTSPPVHIPLPSHYPPQLHQLSHAVPNPLTHASLQPQIPEVPLHYQIPEVPLHYQIPEVPLHYQVPEMPSQPQAPILPQVNQVSMIPPSYAPQLDFYQQSASPVPKEQILIDFD